ncbi:hypothetical protein BC833DRAFT_618492 [Globomyces pollinis-pini]|nr:hypothetical protein BC833DRAFT_618492 [Globomyces pollinis-pini]
MSDAKAAPYNPNSFQEFRAEVITEFQPSHTGKSTWLLHDNGHYKPEIQLFCQYHQPIDISSDFSSSTQNTTDSSSSQRKVSTPRPSWNNSLNSLSRLCNLCSTNKTTKWYRDHLDVGNHICKRCYNQRYKERTQ